MIRVRFAPSPTGRLHLGNMRTALFNFLFARHSGGAFILRIEDTDVERVRPEWVGGILEDLRWLGLVWDEGPEKGGPHGPYLQSQRTALYEEALRRLERDGRAYPCYCTEAELAARREEAARRNLPPRYDNRCRTLGAEERRRREQQGIRPAVRFRIDSPILTIHDEVKGDVRFDLDQMMGDFVIGRPDGRPTFHLAVCVDDALMGITHVIRGDDHLSNTPRHVLLFQALGYAPPKFAHMPLTLGPGGEPLSKRLGAVSIAEYRRQGYLADALINAMALLGWSPGDTQEFMMRDELIRAFSLERVTQAAATYSPEKLNWLGGMHLRRASDEEFAARAVAYLTEFHAGPAGGVRDLARKVLLFKDAVSSFGELPAHLAALEPPDSEQVARLCDRKAFPNVKLVLASSARLLERVPAAAPPAWVDGFLRDVAAQSGATGKQLYMPLRLALTGVERGPELRRLLDCLGPQEVGERLRRAAGVLTP